MDASTVFITVSLMMFANGAVLAVVSRDLPDTLRSASRYWQIGTILVAAGCAAFAFGAPLPRPIMLLAANAPMAFGLTAYYAAVQRFDGLRPKTWQCLPAIIATAAVAWFSIVTPDFRIRVIVVSLAWIWLMGACVVTLRKNSKGNPSVSRRILTGLFLLILSYAAARLAAYLVMGVGSNFAVESGVSWLNLLSPIFMAMLPVVGTTVFLLMCSDSLKRQLESAASTDYLTGLPNRRTLARCGKEAFQNARQERAELFVAIFDMDNFKSINDTFGHEGGDQALIHVAGLLRDRLGTFGMIARTGGEEFALLMPRTGRGEGLARIEEARSAIEHGRFRVGPNEVPLTISGGATTFCATDTIFDDILRRADQALYKAKANGRNRIEFAPLDSLSPARQSDNAASHRRFARR
ncbi:MAG: diguanylate cyclase [Afipia sp.]|nr:diguanylate cyclase [Afipia sp.]OJW63690.1 MAG: GGDEF domain-containing protein [Afipia sp. 64-13]